MAAVDIGAQLRAWRKHHNLTADQLADRAGISRGTLQRSKTGDPGVNFDALVNVAQPLGALDERDNHSYR